MKKRRFRRLALPFTAGAAASALRWASFGDVLYGLDALPALAPSLPKGRAPAGLSPWMWGRLDATLVLTETHTMLIDCGDRGSEGVMDDYLRQYGVSRIDSLVITHPHSDHIGTAPYLLSHYPVGEVLMPAIPDALLPTTDLFFSFLEALERSEATPRTAAVGDRLELGAAVARVIGPAQEFDDLNNISLCMMISLGEAVFLLTGDAESAAERALVESGQPLGCDVLFVGHHGSRTSTSAAFLAAASPRVAVISLGRTTATAPPRGAAPPDRCPDRALSHRFRRQYPYSDRRTVY